ncbi:hypothetical protein [Saccharothrix sp. HUAS TT1]|uniref:hypothetical protein n=1 Tax=unclassified Saccharothrix TaxID=2593673 RepID=UPI00345C2E10
MASTLPASGDLPAGQRTGGLADDQLGRYDYEPARPTALPVEETWDTRAYLRHVPGVFEAVRLGKALESYDLFWLEDATPGEVFNSIHDHRTWRCTTSASRSMPHTADERSPTAPRACR